MESLGKDGAQAVARHLSCQSLAAFFRTSQTTRRAAEQHINSIQHKSNTEYLTEIFKFKGTDALSETLAASVEFINYQISPESAQHADNLAQSLRYVIANIIQPKVISGLLTHLSINPALLNTQVLLRQDATFGQPNVTTHNLSLYQLSVALAIVIITFSYITSPPPHSDLAKITRNWILYQVHHNQEAQRLGDNVALIIKQLIATKERPEFSLTSNAKM